MNANHSWNLIDHIWEIAHMQAAVIALDDPSDTLDQWAREELYELLRDTCGAYLNERLLDGDVP